MIVISYSLSLRALDHYIQNYNAGQKQLSQQVRQGVSATAKEIIRLYGRHLTKIKLEVLDINNLPPLRTNNCHLAKVSNASSRTIQRHLKRLMDARIITRKVFRGSKGNYELWINPKMLWINCEELPNSVKNGLKKELNLNIGNQLVTQKNTTSCPHRDSGNNNTNIIKGVSNAQKQLDFKDFKSFKTIGKISKEILAGYTGEKVQKNVTDRKKTDSTSNAVLAGYTGEKVRKNVTDRKKMNSTSNAILAGYTGEKVQKNASYRRKTGNTGCENPVGPAGEKSRKKIDETEGAGEKVRTRINTRRAKEKKNSNFDEVRSASLNLYVSMLWELAKKMLYADVFLTDHQCEIGKKLIRKWYEPIATERLAMVHQVYVFRIGLVRKFLNKDPKNRFVQLPYLYFDVHNPSGFAGTKKWWLKQQKRNIEVEEKVILHRQIKRLLNNKNKDGNESAPPLKLYLECEDEVRKLDKPQLLQKFYAAVSNQCIHQQIHQ